MYDYLLLLTIAAFYLLRNTARSMNYSAAAPEPGLMEAFAAVTQAVRTATRQSTLPLLLLLLPTITMLYGLDPDIFSHSILWR